LSSVALSTADLAATSVDGTDSFRIVKARLRNFRNHESAEFSLGVGTTVVHGPTGAGKTNLLEAIHFALTGKSCRSANDRDLISFGERSARAVVEIASAESNHTFETNLEKGKAKLLKVDGVPAGQVPTAIERPHICVFMPDRLELVAGPARVRRERFDGYLTTLWPARRATRQSYVRALAQRNALIGRVRSGESTAAAMGGWNHELARHGLALMEDRSATVDLLAARFTIRAAELGLRGEATLTYRPRSRATSVEGLEAELADRFDSDVERGFTGHGPHRDDYRLEVDGREARRFASQGQQRLALLALILAERDAVAEVRGQSPLLLLDDVLSELDAERRSRLLDTLARAGQALLTTAEPDSAWSGADAVSALRLEDGGAGA
jgi:DNA replication and repair protein RecF